LISSTLIPAADASALCVNKSCCLKSPLRWICLSISFCASTSSPAAAKLLALVRLNWPPTNAAASSSEEILLSKSSSFSVTSTTCDKLVPNLLASTVCFTSSSVLPLNKPYIVSELLAISSNILAGATPACFASSDVWSCRFAAVDSDSPPKLWNIWNDLAAASFDAPKFLVIIAWTPATSSDTLTVSPRTPTSCSWIA